MFPLLVRAPRSRLLLSAYRHAENIHLFSQMMSSEPGYEQ
jgi:hypothetical protein